MTRSLKATGIIFLFLLAVSAQSFALHKVTYRRGSRHHRVRRVLWNPMFRGSHEMLVTENEKLDALELPRIEDDDELELLEENEDLVPLSESRSLKIASNSVSYTHLTLPTNSRV